MEVMYPRCCGLDVHKSSITACVLIAQSGKPLKIVAHFPPPKILSVELLSQEIEKSENGYWNRLKPEDQKQALDELMKTAKVEGGKGINTEAKKNLEEKLRKLAEQKGSAIQFEYGFNKKQ